MTEQWKQFLSANGAQFTGQETVYFTSSAAQPDASHGFVTPLTQLGVILADGLEAADFLHKQLSNDVNHLEPGMARLAGYCTPKGRLLATLLLWREGEQIALQLSRPLLPAILKRLRMFILRSKVSLNDGDDQTVTLGLGGMNAASALTPWFATLPASRWSSVSNASGTLIRVADAFGTARYQWRVSPELAQQAWPQLCTSLAAVGSDVWGLAEIAAGMPLVTTATQEKFVPQMINFELIGGVNFKKGCYPGQEIVARSQYLGKLKRRMHLASIRTNDEVKPGDDVFSLDDPEQACGMVVNAERGPDGAWACLIEMKIAMLESDVRLGAISGPPCYFGTLPYALIDQE
jgi:folate-binding protein YgfZ